MESINHKTGDFVEGYYFNVKLVEPINDSRLHPDMEYCRSVTHMFRSNSYKGRDFMSNNPDSCDAIITAPEKHYMAKLVDDVWWWVNECAQCCGHERDWMGSECEKHDICSCCSKPRAEIEGNPWGGKHGWTCNSCAEIKASILKQERLEAVAENEYDEWDYYNESEMKCPHCATVFEQDGQEPDEKQECGVCGGEFKVTVEYSITYSTEVIGERLLPDSHDEEAA